MLEAGGNGIMTIKEAKNELKKDLEFQMLKDENGDYIIPVANRTPVCLRGIPGIGKTSIVPQVAKKLGIGFALVSLAYQSRNTVLGFPTITELEVKSGECIKYTQQTMPEILANVYNHVAKGEKEGILLLDEFNMAAESVVPLILTFLKTRAIGNYRLPEGWSIVLCSDSPAYNTTAGKFDVADTDLVRVLDIRFNIQEFLAYGKEKNIHRLIQEYLKIYKEHAYICEAGKKDFVTAREWENLSVCLKAYEKMGNDVTGDLILQYIKSREVAHSFYTFYVAIANSLPEETFSDIMEGKDLQRYVGLVKNKSFAAKFGIVDQLVQETAASAREYELTDNIYQSMQNAYSQLMERQDIDGKRFYTILANHSLGNSSYDAEYEKKLFGCINPCQEERDVYCRLVEKLNQKNTKKPLSHKDLLAIMDEFICDYYNRMKVQMAGTNAGITNVITFLKRIQDENENYADIFVEKINNKPEVLNVIKICRNKAYSDVIFEMNDAGSNVL